MDSLDASGVTLGPMNAVLGIDAAWSERNDSGVALLQRVGSRWVCRAATPSQAEFLGRPRRVDGDPGTPSELLAACHARLGGSAPVCIAVDMPLATGPVQTRRAADNQISRQFGARKCATHSPTPTRPGPRSDMFTAGWSSLGYPLSTRDTAVGTVPGLIEVYPHPALVVLCSAAERLPYKIGKLRTYWPGLDAVGRRAALVETWRRIVDELARHIDGIAEHLESVVPPPSAPVAAFKRYEDALDAAVCAWVGACYVDRQAEAFGDDSAAIWLPIMQSTS